MNLLGYLCVFLFAVALCSGQDSTSSDPTDKTVTTELPTSTSQKPDTTSQSPDTTKVETTSTSSVPLTTSSTPETTSPSAETTTPGGQNETTVSTTTTAAPTTAEPSTPAPPSPDLRFEVDYNNITCILAQMEITISVNYPVADGFKMGNIPLLNNDVFVNLNQSTICNDSAKEPLAINFHETNEITFVFTKDSSKISVNFMSLELKNLTGIFNDSLENEMTLHFNGSLFETSDGFSYLCNAETKADLNFINGTSSGSSVKFQKVQVQSFIGDGRKDFLSAKECAADDNVSDIVPIAVGCALAGLVVIVLIAYLVGRRQKRQRGYESV